MKTDTTPEGPPSRVFRQHIKGDAQTGRKDIVHQHIYRALTDTSTPEITVYKKLTQVDGFRFLLKQSTGHHGGVIFKEYRIIIPAFKPVPHPVFQLDYGHWIM